MKKKECSNTYRDDTFKRCKQHSGSIVTLNDLQNFVKKAPKEKRKQHQQNEIILQCLMQPVDAKERSHLYKGNEIVTYQLLKNLTILLESPYKSEREEQIKFPSVNQRINKNKENTSMNQMWKFQQPLAVVWDQPDMSKKQFIGFLLGENEDTLQADHLIGSNAN